MKKFLLFIFLFLLISPYLAPQSYAQNDQFVLIGSKEKYEYYKLPVLIGSDSSGILDKNKIIHAFKTFDEFTEHQVSGDTVLWQCLETKNIQMKCVKGDEEHYCRRFVMTKDKRKYFFVSRHCDEKSGCVTVRNEFKKITKNQKHACIAGSGYFESNGEPIWNFEAFKTKQGCLPWFEGSCE